MLHYHTFIEECTITPKSEINRKLTLNLLEAKQDLKLLLKLRMFYAVKNMKRLII